MAFPLIQLGANGPLVEAVGTGLMSLGHSYGDAGDTETRLRYLDELYAFGGRHWDTADIYSDCEEVVGEWFRRNPEKRKDILLATKFGMDLSQGPTKMKVRSDPEYIPEALERSLKKLNTDYVDLYYCHRVDGKTPIEKTVQAMVELKKQKKIKFLGLSEVSARTLRRAHAIHPITAHQTEYSPFTLDIESNGVLDTCKELGIAIVAYSPLGRGFLTGAITKPEDMNDLRSMYPAFQEENFAKNMALVKRIQVVTMQVKERLGNEVTQSQTVLAWLTRQAVGGAFVTPIPGTKNINRLKENLGSMKITLTTEEEKAIREACDEVKRVGAKWPEIMDHINLGDTPELTELSTPSIGSTLV
ncbi:NADP-dependent oxidoreductase domain-containing protein [Diaporthe sp. PMI_573]|nr:NADP-dependent oxidoreductase domain-containing protein [Diaporthaceae sp. PMI_573]